MRKIIMILGMLLLIGCSHVQNITEPLMSSASGADIYPVLYGTDADADSIDTYYIAAEDYSAGTYSRVQIGADDFLQDQWVAQRNSIVYMTDGQWGIVAIEDTSQDLELWAAPQNGWDISGIWTLVDDETTINWEYADGISYQNGIHCCSNLVASIFPDGAGVWNIYGAATALATTFDKNLTGWAISYQYGGNFFLSHNYSVTLSTGAYGIGELNDQIITDESGDIWLFDLDAVNEDLDVAIFDDIYSIMLEDDTTLNAITEEVLNLSGVNTLIDYNAVCNFKDNTIHVVTVELESEALENLGTQYSITTVSQPSKYFIVTGDATGEIAIADTIRVAGSTGNDGDYTVSNIVLFMGNTTIYVNELVPNATADGTLREVTAYTLYNYDLNYYRRDQNGWSDATIIDSWSFSSLVANDVLAYIAQSSGTFPQISIRNNNIVLYYLEAIPDDPAYRDLRRMILPWADYMTYATPSDWDQTTNIDNTTDDIRFCLTIGNHPEL